MFLKFYKYLIILVIIGVFIKFNSFFNNNVLCLSLGESLKTHSLNSQSLGYNSLSGFYVIKVFLFNLILVLNLWRLLPIIGSLRGKVIFVQCLSFFAWGRILLSRVAYNYWYFICHFILDSPVFIKPFLSLIEVVSYFIRPITLSLRLSINLTTGHVLLWLLGNSVLYLLLNLKIWTLLVLLVFSGIFFYEFCIGIIQALVFSLLVNRYFFEHPLKKI